MTAATANMRKATSRNHADMPQSVQAPMRA